ncbi:hypothetical protein WJX73_003073 [Symbiochloris irregularis]|uniref:BZIP domain-containing protein n=1 Tax=Symbiochloris irregularis TaxID=706552 RepID=A0AAW1NQN6_9CHLO
MEVDSAEVRGWTAVQDLLGNDEACSAFTDSHHLEEVLDYLWVPSAEEMSLEKLLQPCSSQEGITMQSTNPLPQQAETSAQASTLQAGTPMDTATAAGAADPTSARSHASAAAARQLQRSRRDLLPERAKERAQRKARKEKAVQAVEEKVQLQQHINDLESRLQMLSVQFAQASAQSAEASRQLTMQAIQQRALEQQKQSANHISDEE